MRIKKYYSPTTKGLIKRSLVMEIMYNFRGYGNNFNLVAFDSVAYLINNYLPFEYKRFLLHTISNNRRDITKMLEDSNIPLSALYKVANGI